MIKRKKNSGSRAKCGPLKRLLRPQSPLFPRFRSTFLLASISLVCLLGLSGCHRVSIDKDRSGGAHFEERQDFYALGLIGEQEIDLVKRCPRGVSSFGDVVSPLDLLFTIGTLGIYAPRTVVVECAR